MNEQLIDQSRLAESVSEKILYDFRDKFLVKPLDPIKVKKEISTPVTNNEATEDKNGVKAVDYDNVKTEVVEVDSDYRKGVVLKTPYTYTLRMGDEKYPEFPIHIGDVVVFLNHSARSFDLLKDSMIVESYGIIAVEQTRNDTADVA